MVVDLKYLIILSTLFYFFLFTVVFSRSIVVKLTFFSLSNILLCVIVILLGFSFIALLILLIHITGLISLYLWCFKLINWRTSFLESSLLDSIVGVLFSYFFALILIKISFYFKFLDFTSISLWLDFLNFGSPFSNIQNLGSCIYSFWELTTVLTCQILVIIMMGVLYLC